MSQPDLPLDEQTASMAKRNAHIPDATIEQDILDTQREIDQMKAEAKHLAETPLSSRDARWNHMRAESRLGGIAERQRFIEKLQAILAYRRNTPKAAI